MSSRYEFQGYCLQGTAGWMHMKDYYDQFPPDVRKALQDSPFNICAACVAKQVRDWRSAKTHTFLDIIEMMEQQIKFNDGL